jgi:hypothetical protein
LAFQGDGEQARDGAPGDEGVDRRLQGGGLLKLALAAAGRGRQGRAVGHSLLHPPREGLLLGGGKRLGPHTQHAFLPGDGLGLVVDDNLRLQSPTYSMPVLANVWRMR